MDIYQELWDADQRGNGLKPIRAGDPLPDDGQGHIVVQEQEASGGDHRIMSDVSIPDQKRAPYDLCEELLNNYVLDQTKPDDVLPEEPAEVDALLDHAMQTEVMEVARLYAEEQTGEPYSPGRWRGDLHRLWFERFNSGRNQDLSGFEHVFVGEQKGGKLGGYHFWYKYHIDDSHGLLPHGDPDPAGESDDIAAMINPAGHDPGFEFVTLINMLTDPVRLDGWTIEDRLGRKEGISGELLPGHTQRITLSGLRAQLSNKGGTVLLRDADGKTVHSVTYTKSQVRRQGAVVVF